jgi:hypothetical protein
MAPDPAGRPVKPDLAIDPDGVPIELSDPSEGHLDDGAEGSGDVGSVILSDIQDKLANDVPLAPAEKQRMAVTLRLSGATYKQIAGSIGISVSYAHQLVQTALRDTAHDSVEDLRRMQFARLEHMLMMVWPSVAQRDLASIHTAMSIMRDENALMGVDKPTTDGDGLMDAGPTIVATGDKAEYLKALREARERALEPKPDTD